MHHLLEEVFASKSFKNSRNQIIPINSETPKDQCQFLQEIIKTNGFTKSLEIGFAFGLSTLAIIEEIAKNGGRHCVIDKFEMSGWGGNGLELIKQAGYEDSLEFYEKYCYEVLPEFMRAGRHFDFAYIDSTKQFDWLLVDFFYIDKILQTGGVIVFDDVAFPGIRKLLRYISRYPNYKIYSIFPVNNRQSAFKNLARWLRFLPKAKKIIRNDLLLTDYQLGLNSNCVAIQKMDDDKRNWDWFIDF